MAQGAFEDFARQKIDRFDICQILKDRHLTHYKDTWWFMDCRKLAHEMALERAHRRRIA